MTGLNEPYQPHVLKISKIGIKRSPDHKDITCISVLMQGDGGEIIMGVRQCKFLDKLTVK